MAKKKHRAPGLFGPPVREAGDLEIVRIEKLAHRLARRHLADHSHPKSPRTFTQPQLLACLIVKAHLGCTDRKAEELLHAASRGWRRERAVPRDARGVSAARVWASVDVRAREQRGEADPRAHAAESEREHDVRRGCAEGGRLRRQGVGASGAVRSSGQCMSESMR